ncbi:MAG: hypothetical protein ABEH59_01425 [Halobacteriales archaeon]
MPVDRRRYLAAASLGLTTVTAGCSNGIPRLSKAQPDRVVALRDVETVGSDHPVEFDVVQSETAMGAGSVPTTQIVLQNTSESALFLGYRGPWPPGGLMIDRDNDHPGLRLLAASEASDLTVDSEGCPSTGFRPIVEEPLAGHRLPPDRRYRVSYRVLGSNQELDTECPPAGRYRWRSSYEYAAATTVETVGWDSADRTRFDWGFSLDVRKPTGL